MAVPVTLRDQINTVEDLDISYRNLHSVALIQDADTDTIVKVPFMDIISKYSDFLSNIILTAELKDDGYFKYRYRPKMLSKDIYGTTELWFILLNLNGCKSIMEFDTKIINYYDPTRLKDYLNEIMVLEGLID